MAGPTSSSGLRPAGTVVRIGMLSLWSGPADVLLSVPEGEFRHVTTVNAEIFVLAHEDPAYGALVRGTTACIDGRPLQWLAARRSRQPITKLSGSDFILDAAYLAPARRWRLFLLGASATANDRAQQALRALAPGLAVAGYAPPFGHDLQEPAWNRRILEQIEAARPTHLLVAFGPPRQEWWIAQHREALRRAGVRFAAGVGGAIDFAAGVRRRAPRWMQRAGLEWAHRLALEPARWRRTLRAFRMFVHLHTR